MVELFPEKLFFMPDSFVIADIPDRLDGADFLAVKIIQVRCGNPEMPVIKPVVCRYERLRNDRISLPFEILVIEIRQSLLIVDKIDQGRPAQAIERYRIGKITLVQNGFLDMSSSSALFQAITRCSASMTKVASGRKSMMDWSC